MASVAQADRVRASAPELVAARSQIALGKPTKALSLLKHFVFDHPDCAEAFLIAAGALRRLGRFEAAKAALTQCYELDPDSLEALNERALLFLATEQLDEAKSAIAELLQLVGDDIDAWITCARILLANNEVANAAAAAQRAIELAPDNAEAHALLGSILTRSHKPNHREAERQLRLAILLNPGDTSSIEILHTMLLTQGRSEEARALIGRDLEPIVEPRIVDVPSLHAASSVSPTIDAVRATTRATISQASHHNEPVGQGKPVDQSKPVDSVMPPFSVEPHGHAAHAASDTRMTRASVRSIIFQLGLGLLFIAVATQMVFARVGFVMAAIALAMISMTLPVLVNRVRPLWRVIAGIPLSFIGLGVAFHFLRFDTLIKPVDVHWKALALMALINLVWTIAAAPNWYFDWLDRKGMVGTTDATKMTGANGLAWEKEDQESLPARPFQPGGAVIPISPASWITMPPGRMQQPSYQMTQGNHGSGAPRRMDRLDRMDRPYPPALPQRPNPFRHDGQIGRAPLPMGPVANRPQYPRFSQRQMVPPRTPYQQNGSGRTRKQAR